MQPIAKLYTNDAAAKINNTSNIPLSPGEEGTEKPSVESLV